MGATCRSQRVPVAVPEPFRGDKRQQHEEQQHDELRRNEWQLRLGRGERVRMTTNPDAIPIKLSTTCTVVKTPSGTPHAIVVASVLRLNVRLDFPEELVDAA